MDIKKRDLPRGYGSPGKIVLDAGRFATSGRRLDWSYRSELEAVPGTILDGCYDLNDYKNHSDKYDVKDVPARKPRRSWKFKVTKADGQTKVMTASKVYRSEQPEDKPQPVRKVTSATTDDRGQRDYWNAGVRSQFKSLV